MIQDIETLKKHEDWNESYYFNFHDSENNLTAFMRIGNKVNKNEKMMFFYIMTDKLTAGVKMEAPCGGKPLNIAGLDYQEMGGDKWKLTYKGPMLDPSDETVYQVNMDVTWQALNPVMDYMDCVDEKGVELSKNVASGHIEQFGKASGKIKIDDQEYHVSGMGERDESIGVRAWSSPKMWMWINSAFSEDEAFNVTKLSVEEGEVDAGYFHTNHRNMAIIKSDVDLKLDNWIPSKFTMKLGDNEDNQYQVEGEVIRFGLIPVDERMNLIETLSKYNWDGKEGYGIAEFLLRKV
ncbi:MAG TPA: hypothetical protein PL055_04490 [Methanobacterium sp.]|nr:hypothetical protein [Methanobacterium sp.]